MFQLHSYLAPKLLCFLVLTHTLGGLASASHPHRPLCAHLLEGEVTGELAHQYGKPLSSIDIPLSEERMLVIHQVSPQVLNQLDPSSFNHTVRHPKAVEFPTKAVVRTVSKPLIGQLICRAALCASGPVGLIIAGVGLVSTLKKLDKISEWEESGEPIPVRKIVSEAITGTDFYQKFQTLEQVGQWIDRPQPLPSHQLVARTTKEFIERSSASKITVLTWVDLQKLKRELD